MDGAHSRLVADIIPTWRAALKRASRGAPHLTVLYSGGLDSSLVAIGLRDLTKVELVTVGVSGSADLQAGEEGAHLLQLPWRGHEIRPTDVKTILDRDRTVLANAAAVSRSVLVSTALALDASRDPHVVCGQGADELFLGYAHFRGLSARDSTARRQEDLQRLIEDDWPRALRLAEGRGMTMASPFLDPDFLQQVRTIPVDQLLVGTERKPLLRNLAQTLGLPSELARRPKRAFQYGSGVDRLLRTLPVGG